MVKLFREFADLDITKERMEVAPTAHYTMGGIKVDAETCATNIKGLYAAGEVTGGIHGANRLGGNSLVDILVFGKIAGSEAAKYAKKTRLGDIDKKEIQEEHKRITKPFNKRGIRPESLKQELQEIMWENVDIIRDEKKLKKALQEIKKLENKIKKIGFFGNLVYNHNWMSYIDISNMVLVAKLVVESALIRKESRGAHYRDDYPKTDEKWKLNIVCKKLNDRLMFSKSKIPPLSEGIRLLLNVKENKY